MNRDVLKFTAATAAAIAGVYVLGVVMDSKGGDTRASDTPSAEGQPGATPTTTATTTAPDPARLAARPSWQKPVKPYGLAQETYDLTAIKSHAGDTHVKVSQILGAGAIQMDISAPGIDCAGAWAQDQQTAANLGPRANYICLPQQVFGKHRWRKQQGLSLAFDASSSVIGGTADLKKNLLVTSWYSNDKDDVYLTPKEPNKSIDSLMFLDKATMTYQFVELVKPTDSQELFDIRSLGAHVGGLAISGNIVYVADTFGMYVFNLDNLTMRDGKYFLPASERWISSMAANDKAHIFGSLAIDSTAKSGKQLESILYTATPGGTSSIYRYSLAKDGTVVGQKTQARGITMTSLIPNAVTTVPLINLQGVETHNGITYVTSSEETVNGAPNVNGLFYWKQGGVIHEQQMPSNGIEQPAIDPATGIMYGLTENDPTPHEPVESTESPRPRLSAAPSPSPTLSPTPTPTPTLEATPSTGPASPAPTPSGSPTPTYRPRTNFLYSFPLKDLPPAG